MATTGAFTNYTEEKIVEVLRGTNWTAPSKCYLALFTAVADGEAGTVTETTYTDYARQEITFTAISSGATANASTITFPANGEAVSSVTITHIGVYDSLTTGDLLLYSDLTTSKTLAPGDVLSFAANAIVFTLN